MDEIVTEFLAETTENLEELDNALLALEQNPQDEALISKIFRFIHTIKGTCGFIGLPRLERVAHKGEDVLGLFRDKKLSVTPEYISLILRCVDAIKTIVAEISATGSEPEGNDAALIADLEAVYNGTYQPISQQAVIEHVEVTTSISTAIEQPLPATSPEVSVKQAEAMNAKADQSGDASGPQSLRVNVDVLENLMTMVSELVLTRNQLMQTARQLKESDFVGPLQRLNYIVSELQEGVMKTRMQPIGNAWSKLPRIVRDISNELGKKIDLTMQGQDTELDRQVLEMIKDPLTHMIRNSVDHGIEMPVDRISSGKSEMGTIALRSFHQGGHIIIEIADDGKGLPVEKIKKKIVQNGLATEEQVNVMPMQQIQQYIFHPGLSTADKVTSVSGRGVGMDVVKSNIEKIGGSIELSSKEGVGTTFLIKIPLTLAIVSALIVGVGDERFAIPQLAVSELVMLNGNSSARVEEINNTPILRLRDTLLPLLSFESLLNIPNRNDQESRYAVVMSVASQQFAILVDKIHDMEEIVIKPVAKQLKSSSMFSGNTILGDGQVIMILDPSGIVKCSGLRDSLDLGAEGTANKNLSEMTVHEETLLLFNAGDTTLKAVPLNVISRLDEISIEEIEHSNGQQVVQYMGKLMPIYNFDSTCAANGSTRKYLIIFENDKKSAGLVADKILDITKYYGDINLHGSQKILDSVIINEHATEVVNLGWFTNAGVIIDHHRGSHV